MIKYTCDRCAVTLEEEWVKNGCFMGYFHLIRFSSPNLVEEIAHCEDESHFCQKCYQDLTKLIRKFYKKKETK